MKKTFIPAFSLQQQIKSLKVSIFDELNKIFDQQAFVGGVHVDKFEEKLSQYLGVDNVVSCNSGTDALWLALKALNLQPDSIVLTTPLSFIASASEIVAHGATPVFTDIDLRTYNIDPIALRNWLEAQVKIEKNQSVHVATGKIVSGIVAVDLFGHCIDYTMIRNIADEYHLWIVEDACQSIGSVLDDGLKAGSLGDISCFSFYPTKNLSACGDAGACATNNPAYANTLRKLKNHGRSRESILEVKTLQGKRSAYGYQMRGINSRMDSIQAAILLIKLDKLDEYNEQRRLIAQHYDHLLSGLKGLIRPKVVFGRHVYHQYSILMPSRVLRDDLQSYLSSNNIQTRLFYPELLCDIPFLKQSAFLQNQCPVAHWVVERIISLPMWPDLPLSDVEYVCDHIKKFMAMHDLVVKEHSKQRPVSRV